MRIKSLAVVCLIFLSTSEVTLSQKFRNKQFALFEYNVYMSNSFREKIQHIEPYIVSNFEFNLNVEDKFEAIIYYTIFNRLQDKLEKEIGIDVLPITSFLDKVKYNEYGYPASSIRKAISLGDSQYYFKIQVSIEPYLCKQTKTYLELKDSTLYELADENSPNTFQPEVTIEMTIFNKEGILPVKKIEGTGYCMKPSVIEESFMYNILPGTNQSKSVGEDDLSSIIDNAIHNVVKKCYK